MGFSYQILFFTLLISHWKIADASSDLACEARSTSHRTLNLVLNSKKDETGEWLTTYHASSSDPATTNIKLNMSQTIYQCDIGQAVHLKGVIQGERANGAYDTNSRHKFHPNCGKNAAISNDGRSAQKIKSDDPLNGVLLTQRPLRRNELFEVRLDKKNTKFNYCLGIGVTIYNPETFTIPDHIWNFKSGHWMMYHSNVYTNGTETLSKYGRNFNELQAHCIGILWATCYKTYKDCLKTLQCILKFNNSIPEKEKEYVGDRVGVMVTNMGVLHFFVNGEDQGPAASNIQPILYGVFELYYNAIQGTIVDSSP